MKKDSRIINILEFLPGLDPPTLSILPKSEVGGSFAQIELGASADFFESLQITLRSPLPEGLILGKLVQTYDLSSDELNISILDRFDEESCHGKAQFESPLATKKNEYLNAEIACNLSTSAGVTQLAHLRVKNLGSKKAETTIILRKSNRTILSLLAAYSMFATKIPLRKASYSVNYKVIGATVGAVAVGTGAYYFLSHLKNKLLGQAPPEGELTRNAKQLGLKGFKHYTKYKDLGTILRNGALKSSLRMGRQGNGDPSKVYMSPYVNRFNPNDNKLIENFSSSYSIMNGVYRGDLTRAYLVFKPSLLERDDYHFTPYIFYGNFAPNDSVLKNQILSKIIIEGGEMVFSNQVSLHDYLEEIWVHPSKVEEVNQLIARELQQYQGVKVTSGLN